MLEDWLATDIIADSTKIALTGLIIGLAFGALAQASRFCLRSACLEFWDHRGVNRVGASVIIWLCVFGAALLTTQALFTGDMLDMTEIRQLTTAGTLSGAIIGGLVFGIGMILARGCASRLLVLSATGNLRALVAGLIVTVIAQASLTGILSPLRRMLSSWWLVTPEQRNMMDLLPDYSGLILGSLSLGIACIVAIRVKPGGVRLALAIGLGITVAGGWYLTAALSHVSFDPVVAGSVTFTGPSANTLMVLITSPRLVLDFGTGLVPGVFFGAFLSSVFRREFHLQVFDAETGTLRYIIGAGLMGFGGMLAGGCAVGAGITGGAVLSLTAWVALFFMWIGAGIANYVLTNPRQQV